MDTGEIIRKDCIQIAEVENIGEQMTIDEKQIGKKMYTIMSNSKTGQIALLAQTLRVDDLELIAQKYFKDKLEIVQSISCDMSPSYKKFCKITFPNTELVIDKFHVVKYVIDAMQQVRIQIKNNLTLSEEKQSKNKWTILEMLQRSRYILLQEPYEWDQDQQEIMTYLFEKYSELQTAYKLCTEFRSWYDKKNIGMPMYWIEKGLYHWCDLALESKLMQFRAVRKMIEKHHDDIINYFIMGQTNAKAENLNSKIQRFISANYGLKNHDFFMYRLYGYFAKPAPQKKN